MKTFFHILGMVTLATLLWFVLVRDRISTTMIAGGLAGMIEMTLTYPLVFITIQMQLSTGLSYSDVVRRTMNRHGFRGFYHGLGALYPAVVPTQAIRWGLYEAMCISLVCTTTLAVLIAGVASGTLVAALMGVPVESLKLHAISTSMHSHTDSELPAPAGMSQPPTASPAAAPRAKGWAPTIGKKIASQAARFPLHHVALSALCGGSADLCEPGTKAAALLGFLAGVIAGVGVVIVTHPIDVVKSRMQSVMSDQYRNSWHCLSCMVREEGVRSLSRGASLRAFRTCLGTGITFMIVPTVKAALGNL